MTTFEEREKGEERRFVNEQERAFRETARRNRMLGEWAARRLGIEDIDTYARAVVKSDFQEPGDDDVLRKVSQDFADAGVRLRAGELRAKMDELLAVARAQVRGGN